MAVDLLLGGAAFVTGVVSFVSPCIIPMILIYLSAVTGFSVEELSRLRHRPHWRRRVFVSTLVFVASFTIVFTAVGAMAGSAGAALSAAFGQLSVLAGVIFLVMGGLMVVGKSVQPPAAFMRAGFWLEEKLRVWGLRKDDGSLSLAGVFLIGIVFALVCSHCIAPTLYSAIALAASTATAADGALLLFLFSAGLAVPFLLSSVFLGWLLERLKWVGLHARAVRIATGLLLIVFGLLLASGAYLDFVGLLQKLASLKMGASG